jgi:hypothetical protein
MLSVAIVKQTSAQLFMVIPRDGSRAACGTIRA